MDKYKLKQYMDASPDAKLRDLVMKLLYDEIVALRIAPGTLPLISRHTPGILRRIIPGIFSGKKIRGRFSRSDPGVPVFRCLIPQTFPR